VPGRVLFVQYLVKLVKNTPAVILLFWLVFTGTLVYEALAVTKSVLNAGSLQEVIVPHVDALILVVLMFFVMRELGRRHRHLDTSKRSLQAMIDNIPYIVWMKDGEGRFVSVNEGFLKTVGEDSAEAAVGKNDFDFFPEEMARSYLHDDAEAIRSRQKRELEEETLIDGKHYWVHTYKTPVFDAEGGVIGTVGFARDVTVQKEEQYKLQRFIDLQRDILILTDGRELDFANRALLDFFGYDSLAAFKKDYDCICDRFVAHDNFFHLGKVRPQDAHWIETLLSMRPEARTVSMIDADNEAHAFTVSINSFDESDLYVVSFTDISSTVIETLELKSRVLHDNLTGAFNRDYFEHYHALTIEHFASQQKRCAILFFDIDHFKQVNDTYGHNTGDRVLKELVTVVKRFSRQGDVVIRWGGEEFLLLVPAERLHDAEIVAEHIREKVETHSFPGVPNITCSFGVTLYESGEEIRESIERADRALYEAKRQGRNRVIGL